jgi:hypothetical protein
VAEVLAARYALSCASFAGHWGILPADCSRVIFKMNLTKADRSQMGVVIHEVKKVASKFLVVSFIHVSHVCNQVSH